MKTKIYLVCAIAILMSSCSDLLEEDPKGQLTADTYFKTQAELDMSVNALYNMVNSQIYGGDTYIVSFNRGDDATTNAGSNKQRHRDFDTFNVPDNNDFVVLSWVNLYKVIKCANYIVDNASRTPTSEEEINIAIGQAKYWRAFCYFKLVREFGDIPLVLTTDIDYEISPSPVADIYEQIVSDLQDCETLPTIYSTAPRSMYGADAWVTQQVAKSTLSAVYMAMAGWPLNQASNYALAAEKAKEVIDGVESGLYTAMLELNYADVYTQSNNYSKEIILGVNVKEPLTTNYNKPQLFPTVGGWGDIWGEIEFWKEFPDGPRKDATYAKKILLKDRVTLVDWWEKDPGGLLYISENHPMFISYIIGEGNTEYTGLNMPSTARQNSKRRRVLRYSEVLLWYAESQARADGTPNTMAYDCVKQVRERAGLTGLPEGMSGTDFANAALAEHGWEVAGNYHSFTSRTDDQRRMELIRSTFERRLTNAPIEVAPGVMFTEAVPVIPNSWSDDLLYAPYPATEKVLNPNLTR